MSKIPWFLKREGDALLFNNDTGELLFYVPELYFTRKFAIIIGEYVNLIGLFDYSVVDDKGKGTIKAFKLPTVFLARPYEMEKVKSLKLYKDSTEQDYRVLKFKKGDQVIVSVKVPQIVDNAEEFFKIFMSGKIPTSIPYDKMDEYFFENIRLNGANYGINAQMFGLIIGEYCRDPHDIKKPYRLSDMKESYTPVSISEIPKYVSPYSAITSENWDESLANAILNKNAKDTPLEKLITE